MAALLAKFDGEEPPSLPFDGSAYISTPSGDKISRQSVLCGPQNIHLSGKTLIQHGVVIRGDSTTIKIGRYCIIEENVTIRPSYKRYKGGFAFVPMTIGDNVIIGANSVVEAASIGSNVVVGKNCVIGQRAVLKDCTVVLDGTVCASDTMVPPYMCVKGIPGTLSPVPNPECTGEIMHERVRKLYHAFSRSEAW
jgi:dynactin 5|eukprot:Stramenopile-MAST_4_protein_3063